MQQMYELWLSSLTPKHHPAAEASLGQAAPEEKYIAMPTDYAELTVGGRRARSHAGRPR